MRWAHDVRVRLAAIAVGVTVVIGSALGWWVVRSVEQSLTAQSESARAATIDVVRRDLGAGEPVTGVALQQITSGPFAGQIVEISRDGDVVASSTATRPLDGVDGVDGVGAESAAAERGEVLPTQRTVGIAGASAGADFAVTSESVLTDAGELLVSAASPLEPLRRSVQTTRDQLLWALPVLAALVGVLTWWLAGRALRPVERIRSEVDEISGSTLERRVPVPVSGDEVGALAVTMNSMLDRLQHASDRQRQFIADASHELRSPVAAIRTELEVARLTAGPDDWPRVADQVLVEEQRLERVIGDLLTLARLDDAGHPTPTGPVDLAALVTAVVDPVASRAAADPNTGAPAVELVVDVGSGVEAGTGEFVDGGSSSIVGVPAQLERLVTNLLDNARRHATALVRVGVTADGDAVVLTVDDDGPGVPAADRDRIFDRFTRLDDHRSRGGEATGTAPAAEGAGLGLSLVRRIAEVHHATVTVADAPLGGARFSVRFDRLRAAAPD